MTQAIITIGNSQGIILPKEILSKLNLKKGDTLEIELGNDDQIVVSKTGSKKKQAKISPEFVSWLEGFNSRYKNALEELASK